MTYQIRIMKSAQTGMRDIYRYIADELSNPAAAVRRIDLIEEAIHSLRDNPARVPLVRDRYLASKGYRLITVKNHLVFFIIRQDTKSVSVMHVLYGRRDWLRLLKVDINHETVAVDGEAIEDRSRTKEDDAWQK